MHTWCLLRHIYRRVPRDIPPPSAPTKKNGPCLNERIDVIMNAAACYSLKSCWSTTSFLEFRNRYAEALTSTMIRSFKHGPFFFRWGRRGGGCIAVLYMLCMNIYTACIDGSKVIHAVINLQTTGPSCPLMTLEFHTPADIYF